MKLSDFWNDLPLALCDISKEILTQEELTVCNIIVNTSKEFTEIYETFRKNYENIDSELTHDDKEIITKKLDAILIQKADIICRSIKFSVKLMSKLSKFLIEEKDKLEKPPTEILLKTKIFLKITRLIIDNSKNSIEKSNDKQKEFFKMILAFTEKIQEQLYKLANDLINKTMNNRNIDTGFENQNINKKVIGISKIHLEATR